MNEKFSHNVFFYLCPKSDFIYIYIYNLQPSMIEIEWKQLCSSLFKFAGYKIAKIIFWQGSAFLGINKGTVLHPHWRHCGEPQWPASLIAALTICSFWCSPKSAEWNHSYGACHWTREWQKSAHWQSHHPFIFLLEKYPIWLLYPVFFSWFTFSSLLFKSRKQSEYI